jgi:hypothetical protein
VSPSASGSSCAPTVRVSPGTITAGQAATVSGTATAGSRLDLFAYSRPSTTYRRIRTGAAADDGTFTFTIKPTTNTRLYVTSTDSSGTSTSANVPLPVRTAVSLSATRTGTRAYRFTGSTSPRAKGQLVTLYRGNAKVAQARTAADGRYVLTKTFGGSGTFDFHTGASATTSSTAGSSRDVRVAVR